MGGSGPRLSWELIAQQLSDSSSFAVYAVRCWLSPVSTARFHQWTGTLGNGSLSYRTKPTLTMWPSSPAPWGSPKLTETLRPHKNLHAIVYSSFIHNL